MDLILSINKLSKIYQKGTVEIPAVKDVSFEVPKGSYLSIVGKSGSGKSTLLNLVGGLDRPSSGSIQFNGKELGKMSRYQLALHRRLSVGMIFQSFNLLPKRTALENIILPLTFAGMPRRKRKPRAKELLELVGLFEQQEGFAENAAKLLNRTVEEALGSPCRDIFRSDHCDKGCVLEQAMTKDPLNELLTVNHAANLSIRGDWAAGRALMQDVLELHPDSTMLLRSLAKMELMNGNLVEGWKLANRAYQLQPNNPEDISALAQTWVMLGDAEEAGRLVLKGLETSGQNATLLTTHWMALMVGRRFEEAEALVRELKQQFGEGLPESLERNFNFQLGMIAMVRADYPEARRLLMATIREDEQAAYNDDEVTAVTLASLASRELGDTEEAQGLLESAERRIRRGRLNGVDNPDIYYNEAIVLTMHSEPAKALEKLREAYAKGFRQQWVMEIDGRLDSLRQQPEFITLMNRIRDDVSQARMEIQTLALANL